MLELVDLSRPLADAPACATVRRATAARRTGARADHPPQVLFARTNALSALDPFFAGQDADRICATAKRAGDQFSSTSPRAGRGACAGGTEIVVMTMLVIELGWPSARKSFTRPRPRFVRAIHGRTNVNRPCPAKAIFAISVPTPSASTPAGSGPRWKAQSPPSISKAPTSVSHVPHRRRSRGHGLVPDAAYFDARTTPATHRSLTWDAKTFNQLTA